MKIGIMSDVHLYKKTARLECALKNLCGVDLLLVAGDISDRNEEGQYTLFYEKLREYFPDIPVYCVSGNHDNPSRDDTLYRSFEKMVNGEMEHILDKSGAFYKQINESVDLIGLNPCYHLKQFFFPDKGEQLSFLQDKISESTGKYHIVMCHPPLISHNPQRMASEPPYITPEQDERLQKIVDECGNVIFISGHTHVAPETEFDEKHNNFYINDGSICPTSIKGRNGESQQGNVIIFEITDNNFSFEIKGIFSEKMN